MNKLRVEQQKNEPADIFAIRAFAKALPLMDDKALMAAAKWVWARASDEMDDRKTKNPPAEQRVRAVDGLCIVAWIRKRRIETGCSLVQAKEEFDRLEASPTPQLGGD